MRIAFTGKGGSGKTTVSSLFAAQMAREGYPVLALDADINQHIAGALDVSTPLRSMGEEIDEIKRYLRGTNGRFEASAMHKTTPPGKGSRFVQLQPDDWFVLRYAAISHGVYVAGAGEIPEGNIGVKCYHGLNGAVELVLGHMIDMASDYVIVDMTAGADAFSSSLFTKVDALVLVVEPTLKSLSVYEQFLPHAAAHGVPLLVVGNKVEDEEDRSFIEEKVKRLVACIPPSNYVKKRERGKAVTFSDVDEGVVAELCKLKTAIDGVKRNWDELEQRSHEMHRRNAAGWMGSDVLNHIDPDFSLKHAADELLTQR
jgi:CO dehydrogenase maturation factor